MKNLKTLLVVALALILVFALAACDKKEGGEGGGAAAKYEGETAEYVIADKVTVTYPTVFAVEKSLTTENDLTLRKEGEKWEVSVFMNEIEMYYGGTWEDKVESTLKSMYGDKVKPTKIMGLEAFEFDAGAAYKIVGKFDDTYFIEFSCKTIINETEADYNGAFKTPEVQYIIENLKAK